MATSDRLGLAGGVEPLDRELADGLQHPKAVAFAHANEALVDEGLERVDVGIAHVLGDLDGAAAAENSEPGKQPLLIVVEQVVRPLDRRPERLLAGIHTPPALEQVESLGHALEKLVG